MKNKKLIMLLLLMLVAAFAVTMSSCAKDQVFTVAFDVDGGTPINPIEVSEGKLCAEPVTTKEGYTFGGWSLEGVDYSFDNPVIQSITLKAVWIINTYTVKFDYAYRAESVEVEYGNAVAQPELPEREGYEFSGWYVDEEAYDFDLPVVADLVIKAVWKVNTYKVTYIVDGEVFAEKTVEYGQVAPYITAPTKELFDFIGWFDEGGAYDFEMSVKADIELTAAYSLNLGAYKSDLCSKLSLYKSELEGEGFRYNYTQANWNMICGLCDNGIIAVNATETEADALVAYEKAKGDMAAVETLSGKLQTYYNSLSQDNYFDEDWANIQSIYQTAVENMQAYEGGIPYPETIVDNAIAAMDAVTTKAENRIIAASEADKKIRDLNTYVDSLNPRNYLLKNWEAVLEAKAQGTANIKAAVENGINAVCGEYETALTKINAIPFTDNIYYRVEFVVEGQTTFKIDVISGQTATYPGRTPSKAGCTFLGWSLDGSIFDMKTPVTADLTLNAAFSVAKITVTFMLNESDVYKTVEIESGTAVAQPENPTMDGFKFTYWSTSVGASKAYNFATVLTANTVL
ncbi:MAG: InlB B-repeat-containing protein, partial [Clostridia bacterium]|nr:InlB B-repeat-containing protein [Clostridia bacterium]